MMHTRIIAIFYVKQHYVIYVLLFVIRVILVQLKEYWKALHRVS